MIIWAYEYDGRYRLTKAGRGSHFTGPTPAIGAVYEYTYDDGDNVRCSLRSQRFSRKEEPLCTRLMVAPFEDNFNDGDYTGWSVGGGTWSASNHYLEQTGSGGAIYLSHSDDDYDARFSYYRDSGTSYLLVYFRFVDWNNYMSLLITDTQMVLRECVSGTGTDLDTNTSADSDLDTWYEVRIECDDDDVIVWRRDRDAGGEMTEIFDETGVSNTSTARLGFHVPSDADFHVDDVFLVSDAVSTTTTYTYDDANQLLTMVSGKTGITGAATTFTYDDWGRTVSKAQGAHLAEYDYRFGSKLKSVTTDIPDEAGVSYMYDGLGKLRFKDLDADGADKEWYRWDLGWNMLAKYDDDNGAFWDIGTLNMSMVGKRAVNFGSNPATGTYAYMSHDHLGSVRRLRLDNKASVGSYEYTPYGHEYFIDGTIPGFGYTGHVWQPESGMYYAPYRHYTPATARWLTRDPLGMVDGPNVYAYVRGNPAVLRDGLGSFPEGEGSSPCVNGYVACIMAGISSTGGQCQDCMDFCTGQGYWPATLPSNGKSCGPGPPEPPPLPPLPPEPEPEPFPLPLPVPGPVPDPSPGEVGCICLLAIGSICLILIPEPGTSAAGCAIACGLLF